MNREMLKQLEMAANEGALLGFDDCIYAQTRMERVDGHQPTEDPTVFTALSEAGGPTLGELNGYTKEHPWGNFWKPQAMATRAQVLVGNNDS